MRMAQDLAFRCPLPHGVHARPAGALEEATRAFAADISLLNERTGHSANAKSVLGIVGLDIRLDDRCRLVASGPDERDAIARLRQFLEVDFPRCDEPLALISPALLATRLPPVLRQARPAFVPGTPAAPGIAEGRAVWIGGLAIPDWIPKSGVSDVAAEIRLLESALADLTRSYDARVLSIGTGIEADVLRTHGSIARDPGFKAQLASAVSDRRRTAAGAIADAERYFTTMLTATGSLILRERALDIRDVCSELLGQVYGPAVQRATVSLTRDSICLAETLTPGQFLALERRHLKGLALTLGGTTSHTVILARSFGVPAVVAAGGLDGPSLDGRDLIVDAELGIVVTEITEDVRRYYRMEDRRFDGRRERLRRRAASPAATADGHRIEVAANITAGVEVAPAVVAGAESIGMFRTEVLFVERPQAPSEFEQFEEYSRALIGAGGRPVIIRTLDLGGDKPIPYLHLPAEENPFLGYRAVRLYREFEPIVRDQIRALVRASACGRLWLMVPMVSTLEEFLWVKALVADEQRRLAAAGTPYDASMPVGVMVEVPSAVFLLERLCREVDFLSIGTNDLLQYFFAADRTNPRVAALQSPAHPAFLRLLKQIVDSAHAGGRWVGLCGEMAGQLLHLPLLVGLGLDEISLGATAIPEVKAALAELTTTGCQSLLRQALDCSTAAEVNLLLGRFGSSRAAPLVEEDLILTGVACPTKEAAIKHAADQLYVTGRTNRPREIEDAVWQREALHDTGLGHGFAVPFCRTDALLTDSLVALKLDTPVEWGSPDEEPVRVVLLLAIRESGPPAAHVEALATLNRRLGEEEFRARLTQEAGAGSLCRLLAESVGQQCREKR